MTWRERRNARGPEFSFVQFVFMQVQAVGEQPGGAPREGRKDPPLRMSAGSIAAQFQLCFALGYANVSDNKQLGSFVPTFLMLFPDSKTPGVVSNK